MIFKYKTISVSKEVEEDLNKINEHKECIIRAANIQSNGTLIHDEVIDPNLIELEAENDRETRLLKSIVQTAGFYFDESTGLYLDNQLDRVIMYENGLGHKDKYLNYIPQIRSNVVPYRINSTENVLITDIQFDRTLATSGDMIQIKNLIDDSVIYTISCTTDEITTIIEDVNTVIPSDAEVACYLLGIRQDNPSVVMGIRKIWEV
jgi:hypothetical protein